MSVTMSYSDEIRFEKVLPSPRGSLRLHGGWRPGSVKNEQGHFSFWGELSEVPARVEVPEEKQLPRTGPQPHPAQASLEELGDAMTSWGLPGVSGRGAQLPAAKVVLTLPIIGRLPVPAVERPVLSDGRKRPRKTEDWTVQVLHSDLASAVEALGAIAPTPPEGIELGPDLVYWSKACGLVLHLLARQRFAPALIQLEGPEGSVEGHWVPVLDDPKDCERISALITSMPPGCEAFSSETDAPTSPKEIIKGFLQAATDACVRKWLVATIDDKIETDTGPAGDWFGSLLRKDPSVKVSKAQGEHLLLGITAWMRPLEWAGSVSSLRTCIRLEEPLVPPTVPGQKPWAPGPKDKCWTLRYLVQALDDQSLLVDASEVFDGSEGPGAALLRQRMADPRQQVLSDLGRVSRFYEPVRQGLQGSGLSGANLTTGEALNFLTDIAPLLEESGLTVLLPPWWKAPGARLGVKLHVKRKTMPQHNRKVFTVGALSVFDWQLAVGGAPLSPEELMALSSSKEGLVHLRGLWVSVDPAKLAATADRWKKGGEASLIEVIQWSEGLDSNPKGLEIVGVDAEGQVGELLERLKRPETLSPVATPDGFKGTLRPYQERGLAWLSFMGSLGLGMCLADDMGLGKTVQVLAMLQSSNERAEIRGPTLLVCPTSVAGNWAREATKFTPDIKVVVHHGADRPKGDKLLKCAQGCDLLVTSYQVMVRDHADLMKVPWLGFILDEAQAVKNPGTKQTQACRRIGAYWRIAMTGTPVENSLLDLYSIFSILNPGYLGGLDRFRDEFVAPIEEDHDKEAATRLKGLVGPFLLRRLKTDPGIAPELPPKVEMKENCVLTKEQAGLYQAFVDRMMSELDGADRDIAVAKKVGGAALRQAYFKRGGIVMNTLLRLKQVCNHPAHALGDGSPIHGRSGKIGRLLELLEEVVAAGERALVFTQFPGFAQYLQPYLADRLGAEVLFLHGGTPRLAREEMIKRFQSAMTGKDARPVIFLLSLKAGGVGLNLTAANHVIHIDRWWNPAVEDQATDRAYRIGQNRTVLVRKLVTSGTLEDTIDALLAHKREIAKSVVGGGEDWLTQLSTKQLRELVKLRGSYTEG